MLLDITLKITPKMVKTAENNEKKALVGHLGTHFDVMDGSFTVHPLKNGWKRCKRLIFLSNSIIFL